MTLGRSRPLTDPDNINRRPEIIAKQVRLFKIMDGMPWCLRNLEAHCEGGLSTVSERYRAIFLANLESMFRLAYRHGLPQHAA